MYNSIAAETNPKEGNKLNIEDLTIEWNDAWEAKQTDRLKHEQLTSKSSSNKSITSEKVSGSQPSIVISSPGSEMSYLLKVCSVRWWYLIITVLVVLVLAGEYL